MRLIIGMSTGTEHVDVALVGGGIMSATLGSMMGELMPGMSIQAFERMDQIAVESSNIMNNAGTGHAGNCELNYTPRDANGGVDITKALEVNESFEISLQFWSHLVETGSLPDPRLFLNAVPHFSFVWGEDDVSLLAERHKRLSAHHMFADMELTRDPARIKEWLPLVMDGRDEAQPVAATRVGRGTDIDFGRLTHELFEGLERREDFTLHLNHQVETLERDPSGGWRLGVKDRASGGSRELHADFVFLGAGGGALPLLQRSGISEGRGYGGFPVSGQFLVCTNPEVIARHQAKVYGMAEVGAPPMSLPHLDTRVLDGEPALLFGPYAGFTTRYLKEGSYWDLFGSLRASNLGPMLAVARDNMDLTRYLIGQAMQSPRQRLETLRRYVPEARAEDWQLATAGQRVQIIKRDPERTGRLEFGTELVTAADGSLAALLGASPGASTAACAMLTLIHRCFPERTTSAAFQERVKGVVPSCGHELSIDAEKLREVRGRVNHVLGLPGPAASNAA